MERAGRPSLLLLSLIDNYDVPITGTDVVADGSGSGYGAKIGVIKKIQTASEDMIAWCAALSSSKNSEDVEDATFLRLSGIFDAVLGLINSSCNNENAKNLRAKVKQLKETG